MYALIDTTKESEAPISSRRSVDLRFKIRHKTAENPLRNWPSFANSSVIIDRGNQFLTSESSDGDKCSRITRRKHYQTRKNRSYLTLPALESCEEGPEKTCDHALGKIESPSEFAEQAAEHRSAGEQLEPGKVDHRRRFKDKQISSFLPAVVIIIIIVMLFVVFAMTDQRSELDDNAKFITIDGAPLVDMKNSHVTSNDNLPGQTKSVDVDSFISDDTSVTAETVTANTVNAQIQSLRQENSLLKDAIAMLEGETLTLNSELLRLELDLVEANYLARQIEESRKQTVYNFVNVPLGKGVGSTPEFQ